MTNKFNFIDAETINERDKTEKNQFISRAIKKIKFDENLFVLNWLLSEWDMHILNTHNWFFILNSKHLMNCDSSFYLFLIFNFFFYFYSFRCSPLLYACLYFKIKILFFSPSNIHTKFISIIWIAIFYWIFHQFNLLLISFDWQIFIKIK